MRRTALYRIGHLISIMVCVCFFMKSGVNTQSILVVAAIQMLYQLVVEGIIRYRKRKNS